MMTRVEKRGFPNCVRSERQDRLSIAKVQQTNLGVGEDDVRIRTAVVVLRREAFGVVNRDREHPKRLRVLSSEAIVSKASSKLDNAATDPS